MIRPRASLFSFLCFLFAMVLALAACKKDELTITSTVPPANTHLCQRVIVELDVDSLDHCDPPGPGAPDLSLTICACDTLELRPVNMPIGASFDHWHIEQGGKLHHFNELVLDTITVPSDLLFQYDTPGPGGGDISIDVDVEPCE